MAQQSRPGEPAAWLIKIKTAGLGRPRRKGRGAADRKSAQPQGVVLDENARKQIVTGLRRLLEVYPINLLAARVGPHDMELVLRCPASDLPLLADLIKTKLSALLRESGLRRKVWRRGYLRRALGTDGTVRRVIVRFRSDARAGRATVLDLVRNDEKLGVRRGKRKLQ